MSEIDTIFSVRSTERLMYIEMNYLLARGLSTPNKLSSLLTENIRPKEGFKQFLEDFVAESFISSDDPKKTSSLSKFRQREDIIIEELKGIQAKDKIPIFCPGEVVMDINSAKKFTLDPFSSLHQFTNKLLTDTPKYDFPSDFLERFQFIFVQPTTYIVEVRHDTNIFLEDIFRESCEHKIETQGVPFGELTKSDFDSYRIGNSVYNRALTNFNIARVELSPKANSEAVECVRLRTLVNQHILGIKYAHIIDSFFSDWQESLMKIPNRFFPLYMESGCVSKRILDIAARYSENYAKFDFLGDGILNSTGDSIPLGGICHPTALGYLYGFMRACYNGEIKSPARTKKVTKDKVTYRPSKLPFFLAENETTHRHPNIADVAEHYLSPKELSLVEDFANFFNIGFARIEPRIVELFSADSNIYTGFRNMNKQNIRWFTQLKDKELVTPDMILGFFNMPCIEEVTGEFRGSELSLPGIHINQKWIDNCYKDVIDTGCSIQRVIGCWEFSNEIFMQIIKANNAEYSEEFQRIHFSDGTSKPAIRGTAIHTVTSAPLDNLVHYNTLELINLQPKPSNLYSEMPFSKLISLEDISARVSLHPDGLFFLKKSPSIYDVVVWDTKTNRVTPYPEHKYLLQLLMYGWFIGDCVEDLGIRIENIYTVLNKNAFHRTLDDTKLEHLGTSYRPQKHSPITLFIPSNPVRQLMPKLVREIIVEKRQLRTNSEYFSDYKKTKCKDRKCSKCYDSNRLVCDWMQEKIDQGYSIQNILDHDCDNA